MYEQWPMKEMCVYGKRRMHIKKMQKLVAHQKTSLYEMRYVKRDLWKKCMYMKWDVCIWKKNAKTRCAPQRAATEFLEKKLCVQNEICEKRPIKEMYVYNETNVCEMNALPRCAPQCAAPSATPIKTSLYEMRYVISLYEMRYVIWGMREIVARLNVRRNVRRYISFRIRDL